MEEVLLNDGSSIGFSGLRTNAWDFYLLLQIFMFCIHVLELHLEYANTEEALNTLFRASLSCQLIPQDPPHCPKASQVG